AQATRDMKPRIELTFDKNLLLFLTARHRNSNLFPYTTLFRSELAAGWPAGCEPAPRGRSRRPAQLRPARKIRRPPGSPATPRSQDRKSTRLNSSHLGISYAVFCLKKKTRLHVMLHFSGPVEVF